MRACVCGGVCGGCKDVADEAANKTFIGALEPMHCSAAMRQLTACDCQYNVCHAERGLCACNVCKELLKNPTTIGLRNYWLHLHTTNSIL